MAHQTIRKRIKNGETETAAIAAVSTNSGHNAPSTPHSCASSSSVCGSNSRARASSSAWSTMSSGGGSHSGESDDSGTVAETVVTHVSRGTKVLLRGRSSKAGVGPLPLRRATQSPARDPGPGVRSSASCISGRELPRHEHDEGAGQKKRTCGAPTWSLAGQLFQRCGLRAVFGSVLVVLLLLLVALWASGAFSGADSASATPGPAVVSGASSA